MNYDTCAFNNKSVFIGIIEGFFGRSWSWQDRKIYAGFLKQHHYQFYIYAPKSDPHLRRQWQEDWPSDSKNKLLELRHHYKNAGILFGIGLSPFEIYLTDSATQQQQLSRRIREINQLNPDILCILFDDMRGDIANLAQLQIDIAHQAAAESTAKKIIFCPTYYSVDPVLEKVFGNRPENYWQTFAANLDSNIDIFWTGEKVCSSSYSATHLAEVTQLLGRKPFLWDNYPVNDGAIKSKLLHLRAFNQAHSQLNGKLAGHAVNPMNQPYLSQLALASLPFAYQQENNYHPDKILLTICNNLCDTLFTDQLLQDLSQFQDLGLAKMTDTKKNELRIIYGQFQHNPYAKEIVAWLNDEYQFDPHCLTE
jgi:hyaluronoglucosaminidase